MNAEDFKAYYAQLTDGELAKIASSRRILVPDARASLDEEVAKRRLTPEDLKRFRNYRHDSRIEQGPLQRKIRRSKLLARVNDLRKAPRLGWRGILAVMGGTIVVAALFDRLGMLNLTMPVVGSIAVFYFTLRYHWELRHRPWYWATIAGWAAAHVWIIVRVRWPGGWVPARVLEGYCTIDLVALFVVIAWMEKMLHEGRYAKRRRAQT